MRTNTMNCRLILLVLGGVAISAPAVADTPAPPETLMCTSGELIFAEEFDPETVSERWGFSQR